MESDIDYASPISIGIFPRGLWMQIRPPGPVRFIRDGKLFLTSRPRWAAASWPGGTDRQTRGRLAHHGRKVQVYMLLQRPAQPSPPGRHYRLPIRRKFSGCDEPFAGWPSYQQPNEVPAPATASPGPGAKRETAGVIRQACDQETDSENRPSFRTPGSSPL